MRDDSRFAEHALTKGEGLAGGQLVPGEQRRAVRAGVADRVDLLDHDVRGAPAERSVGGRVEQVAVSDAVPHERGLPGDGLARCPERHPGEEVDVPGVHPGAPVLELLVQAVGGVGEDCGRQLGVRGDVGLHVADLGDERGDLRFAPERPGAPQRVGGGEAVGVDAVLGCEGLPRVVGVAVGRGLPRCAHRVADVVQVQAVHVVVGEDLLEHVADVGAWFGHGRVDEVVAGFL